MNVFADLNRQLVDRPGDPVPETEAPVRRRRPSGRREGSPFPEVPNPWGLSPAQAALMQRMVDGLSNKQIAEALAISVKTVEAHRGLALEKMQVPNSTRAAVLWDRFVRGTKEPDA